MQSKQKTMKKAIGFIFRLISLPFWLGLVVIGFTYRILYTTFCYLIWGGELLAYTKSDRVMMADVFNFAKQKMQDEKNA